MRFEVLSKEVDFKDRRIWGVITAIVKPRHRLDRYGRYGLLPLYFLSAFAYFKACMRRMIVCVCE